MKIQNSLKIAAIASMIVLTGCGNRKMLAVENIDYIYVDYDTYSQNNIGTTFPGTVSAQMKSGESIEFSSNKGLSSSENIDINIKDKELAVYFTLPNYKTNKVPVEIYYTDKTNTTITSRDTVLLNFTGNTQAWYNGESGNYGQTGANGTTPLLFRDGTDGGQGGTGQNGADGNNLEIYVWKSSDTLFYYVFNQSLNYGERYMTIGSDPVFYVEASGGRGGNGGTGGQGGTGKNGEVTTGKSKAPGRGGYGGPGGVGGRGGNGGNVTVTIHPSVGSIENRLSVSNSGGYGGSGGSGGQGGSAGTAITGQSPGKPGVTGATGLAGARGVDGQYYSVTKEFDYSIYLGK